MLLKFRSLSWEDRENVCLDHSGADPDYLNIDPDPVHLYDKNPRRMNDSVFDRGICLTLNVHDLGPDLDPEANKSVDINIQRSKFGRRGSLARGDTVPPPTLLPREGIYTDLCLFHTFTNNPPTPNHALKEDSEKFT